MKAIKTLLAVSVLAAAGATTANAAVVATFTYTQNGNVSSSLASGTVTGSGTATLDDSGVFSFTGDTTTSLLFFGVQPANALVNSTTTMTGTLSGNSLAWTTATTVLNNCTALDSNGTGICQQAPTSTGFAADQNPVVFDLTAGGTTVITTNAADSANLTTYTFTTDGAATPSVPVPAAAWLFGSGLLGLAGTARRRRAA